MLADLEPGAILAALAIGDITGISPMSGGWDTSLWRVEHGGLTSALRVFRPEQVETCRREVAAMRLATSAGLPIPEIRSEGMWRGRPVLLLSWCPGETLFAALQTQPGSASALGRGFGQLQARIHAVAVPAEQSHLANDWIDRLGPGEQTLRDRLRGIHVKQDALLHGDYHPLNVMAEHGTVSAVLDWANATAGDPRADVARTQSILRFAAWMPGVTPAYVSAVLRPFETGWLAGYQGIAGPLPEMTLFHAWAAAFMVTDLASRVDLPGGWFTTRHLARLRRRADLWQERAGLS